MTAEIVTALPSFLWVILAGIAFWRLREPIASSLGHATNVEAFGIKLAIAAQSVDLAVDLAQKNQNWHVTVAPEDRNVVLTRAQRERAIIQDAELLWVDDNPGNNRNEARMLTALGAHIAFAASTDQAIAILRSAEQSGDYPIDLIISDMRRGDDCGAGLSMLAAFAESGIRQPVIFYVGQTSRSQHLPTNAFGLTERPDRLLHCILDALERVPRRKPVVSRS